MQVHRYAKLFKVNSVTFCLPFFLLCPWFDPSCAVSAFSSTLSVPFPSASPSSHTFDAGAVLPRMLRSDELPFIFGLGSRGAAGGSDGNAEEESAGAGFRDTLTLLARFAAVLVVGGGVTDEDVDDAHGVVR